MGLAEAVYAGGKYPLTGVSVSRKRLLMCLYICGDLTAAGVGVLQSDLGDLLRDGPVRWVTGPQPLPQNGPAPKRGSGQRGVAVSDRGGTAPGLCQSDQTAGNIF